MLTTSEWHPVTNVVIAIGLVILVLAATTAPWRPASDFAGFYAGAKFVGTNDLYSYERAAELAKSINAGRTAAYVRLPFYAVVLYPLGRLPYHSAFLAWALIAVLALAGFVGLSSSRLSTVAALATSIPLWYAISIGQDVPVLLFLFAVSLRLLNSRREFGAGLAIALCLTLKPHIFGPILIVAWVKRLGRFAAGILCGGLVVVAVSFAVAGPHWISSYLALTRVNENYIPLQSRRSLAGLLHSLPLSSAWIVLASAAVMIYLFLVARKLPLETAVCTAPYAGILVGIHSYMSDCAYIVPLVSLVGMAGWPNRSVALNVLFGTASLLMAQPMPVKPLAYALQLSMVYLMIRAAAATSGAPSTATHAASRTGAPETR